MSDTEFQDFSQRVSEAVGFLMRNPGMLKQAKMLAAHAESLKEAHMAEWIENEWRVLKMSGDMAEMIATTKDKAMPSVAVKKTVASEWLSEWLSENGLES